MIVKMSPTGKSIEGHVLDVAKVPLEQRLRDYDSQLYLKWNPQKYAGWGCWEVRRRPSEYSIVDFAEFEGNFYLKLGYEELDIVHHVLDVPFLNYQVLERIKAMDTWGDKYWAANFDYEDRVARVKHEEKARKEMTYNLKQYKSMFREYREMVLSGRSPAEIAAYWGK